MFLDKNNKPVKMYVKVNHTLLTIDKRLPDLMKWLSDNWDNIVAKYAEINKDSKYVGKVVKYYLTEESFAQLQKELKYYKCNSFKIGLSSNETLVSLNNSVQKKEDDNMAKIPKLKPHDYLTMASMMGTPLLPYKI